MSCLLRPHLTTRRILILPSFFVWFTDALANAKEENVNIHATLDKTLEDLNSFWAATGAEAWPLHHHHLLLLHPLTYGPVSLSVLADCLAWGWAVHCFLVKVALQSTPSQMFLSSRLKWLTASPTFHPSICGCSPDEHPPFTFFYSLFIAFF